MLQDLDVDDLLTFLVFENKLALSCLEVLSSLSNVLLVTELNSLVVNGDTTVTSVLSNDLDLAYILSWSNLDSLSILEANLTWLVVINNGNARLSVLTHKFLVCLWFVELNEEVLIGLPVIIVLNANLESLGHLAVAELNNAIERIVVLVSLGVTVDGASAHTARFTFLINNNNG